MAGSAAKCCHRGPSGSVPAASSAGMRRCQAIGPCQMLPLHPHRREQGQQPVHHEGGPQLRSGDVRRRIADHQSLRGLGQGGVEVLELDAHLLHAAGGQTDAPLGQLLPVVVVEDAAALAHGRQHVVVGPQEEQVLVRVAVVPGDLGDGHLVQRHRDGAHAVLAGHLPQQAAELVGLHGLVPQDLHELVQDAAEDLPQLGGLLRLLEAARVRLGPHLGLQGVLEVQLLEKAVKDIHFSPAVLSVFRPSSRAASGSRTRRRSSFTRSSRAWRRSSQGAP